MPAYLNNAPFYLNENEEEEDDGRKMENEEKREKL